ncbi:MAG: acyl-protein synthetase [Elusimicrobia bacterium]|nr:acyl-protein synthetase [Elusimicrobiota bacterium]
MPDSASPERRPLKSRTAVDRLIESPPFNYCPGSCRLFLDALREASAHHIRACPVFRGLCRDQGFAPDSLRSQKDVERLPFIFVSVFKERALLSVPRSAIVLELTSSGTMGQKSRILLDKTSLLRVRRIAWQVFSALGLADEGVCADYLCFTYDPRFAAGVGTAWTDKLLTGFTRGGEVFYAFKWDPAQRSFRFDLEGALRALERFERSGRQARLIGFPAFALKLCEEFKRRHGRFVRLRPESKVITGGGWKDQHERAVDKSVLRKVLADSLGIPVSSVRDLFGMVEHGVPYVDCGLGNFHIPNYARVLARDPASLKVLPRGQRGLLQFITPYLRSYPSISLLSSDFGSVEKSCPCGLKGPILRVKGRAGVAKPKGCAVAASSMLK